MAVEVMTSPLTSVIIPCYNSAAFIGQTLESVLAQMTPPDEIIVIDDGSTDESCEIITSYPVHYHYQPNRGPAAARNAGLRLAQGKYLAFLDADDVWKPEMLKTCITVLEERPDIGAVHVNWVPIDMNGTVTTQNSGWQPWRGNLFERLLVHIPFNTSAVVWRRECWQHIGGFDETPETNDDWINWLRIAHAGFRFEAIEQPLVYRRIHEGGITRRQSDRVVHWRLNALERICAEYDIQGSVRAQAYASAYWAGVNVALREDRQEDALQYFLETVKCVPKFLQERSTYFAIACHGQNLDLQTIGSFDATKNNLVGFLKALYGLPQVPGCVLESYHMVWGMAWWSLAQLAYGAGLGHEAHRCLWHSVKAYPEGSLRIQNWLWIARMGLGPAAVKCFATLLQKIVTLRELR